MLLKGFVHLPDCFTVYVTLFFGRIRRSCSFLASSPLPGCPACLFHGVSHCLTFDHSLFGSRKAHHIIITVRFWEGKFCFFVKLREGFLDASLCVGVHSANAVVLHGPENYIRVDMGGTVGTRPSPSAPGARQGPGGVLG